MIEKNLNYSNERFFLYYEKHITSKVSMKKNTSYENPVEFLPNEGND